MLAGDGLSKPIALPHMLGARRQRISTAIATPSASGLLLGKPTPHFDKPIGEFIVPVTTGMIGQGFYNRNSAPLMSAIDHVLSWLDNAVTDLSLGDGAGTIGLADFGCSEGRNSIAVMRRLISGLRKRTQRHILTAHSDLPTNDFSELFIGLRPGGQSVFDDPGVSSCAVGGSMFDRLLPPRSLHIAMSMQSAFLVAVLSQSCPVTFCQTGQVGSVVSGMSRQTNRPHLRSKHGMTSKPF